MPRDFAATVTQLLDDLDEHVEREDLGIFPVSVVTLGATGWAIVDRAHTVAELPARRGDQRGNDLSTSTARPHRSQGARMQKESLTALVRHHLETASTASSGRSAHTIYGVTSTPCDRR